MLARIGDGEVEKGRLSMASQGKKKLSTANSKVVLQPGRWRDARGRQHGHKMGCRYRLATLGNGAEKTKVSRMVKTNH